MKRYIFIVIALAMIVGVLPVSASQPLSFTFDGAGWGHGVGFSQWGARGQALEDPTKLGEEIASYYYPGSEPGGLSELELENDLLDTLETPIWVNLESEVTILEFTAMGGSLDLCLSEDGTGTCPKPEQPQSGETWEFRRISVGVCGFFKDDVQQGSSGECRASITWSNADGVRLRDLTHVPRICATSGSSVCEYRHGELKLRDDPVEVGFHVVLAIGLDDYVKGIRELPDDWTSVGVNEAQAIAARSYGAYKFFANEDASKRNQADLNADPGITDSRKESCWCHLYDDTTDMQYVAWDKEIDAPHVGDRRDGYHRPDRDLFWCELGVLHPGGNRPGLLLGLLWRMDQYQRARVRDPVGRRRSRQFPVAIPDDGRRSLGDRPPVGESQRLVVRRCGCDNDRRPSGMG